MNEILKLKDIDWYSFLIALWVLLFCVKGFWATIDWLSKKIGIETKSTRKKRQESEMLKETTELAKTTAKNLEILNERHTKDEAEFRNNLNNYIEESRRDNKALHSEMTKFADNRIHDREQSLEIQKELKDSIQGLINIQQDRDEKINNLTDMFIDKEIDDMRYKILDFASSLSSGKNFNRESYDHILSTYDKYERILEEHNMENGLVEESIKYIRVSYQKFLQNGGDLL